MQVAAPAHGTHARASKMPEGRDMGRRFIRISETFTTAKTTRVRRDVTSARSWSGNINAKASTVLEMGPAVVHDIAQGFRTRGYDLEVELLPSENIEPALKSAAARPDLDAVIVGGGDGSLNVAASLLSGTGKALGVVPLGTVNLLARDLQIPFDVIHAVDALSNATVETIDLAEVNGVTFHSIAGLGFLGWRRASKGAAAAA